jgi:hypothetical protein
VVANRRGDIAKRSSIDPIREVPWMHSEADQSAIVYQRQRVTSKGLHDLMITRSRVEPDLGRRQRGNRTGHFLNESGWEIHGQDLWLTPNSTQVRCALDAFDHRFPGVHRDHRPPCLLKGSDGLIPKLGTIRRCTKDDGSWHGVTVRGRRSESIKAEMVGV